MEFEIHKISNSRFEPISEKIDKYVKDEKLPGVIALVYHKDQIVFCNKWGKSDIESGKEIEFNDIFRIASMTKPIVVMAALMLIEEDRLSLDELLSKYIPKAANLKVFVREENGELITEDLVKEITILDLFTHTIGIGYVRDRTHPIEKLQYQIWKNYENKLLSDLVDELFDIPLKCQPETEWEYGLGIDILAVVIEKIMDKPLDEILQERIFKVLSMEETGYVVDSDNVDRLVKISIQNSEGGLRNAPSARQNLAITPNKHKSGGGGLTSTMKDYLKFAICLMNRGHWKDTRLISEKSIDLMIQDYVGSRGIPYQGLKGGPETSEESIRNLKMFSEGYGHGLGVQVKLENGIVPAGIYGWIGAYTTDFWVDMENKVVGILMSQKFPNFSTPIFNEFRELTYQGLQKSS